MASGRGLSSSSQPSIAECDRILTAPGQVLEMEDMVLHGRRVRVWKHAPRTFRNFLFERMTTYSGRTFLSFPSAASGPSSSSTARAHLTYGEVLYRATELAGWMRGRGLGMGSKVGICGMNSPEWIIAFIATHLIGGVSVCLNAWLPLHQLEHCLTKTKPAVVLVDEERAALLEPSSMRLQKLGVGEMYCWSEAATSSDIPTLGSVVRPLGQSERQRILSGQGLSSLGPESDAVIFFTSGTGGPPRAVLSTQRMALTNLWSGLVAPSRAALRAGAKPPPLPTPEHPQKTVLLAIPLFHVTGCLSWLMRAFFAGSKMVLLPRWSTAEAVRAIQQEGVTIIGGVPAVVSSILHSPLLPKDRSFETVFYGGAPPSSRLPAEVRARWPKAGLVQGYGLTETNAYVCSIAGADYLSRPESTGPVVPVAEVKIVDPATRAELPRGETGLLLVRGPQVMKCYVGDEEATRKAIDKDGWLDTGDGAALDEEGFLYIKDRLKDIIIRGGENIPSSDVENALYAHPGVAEAAAVGIPDPILGEVVGSVVSLHPQSSARPDEAELLGVVRPLCVFPVVGRGGAEGRLSRRAVPVIVVVHPEPLPRNVNGKIVKGDLRRIVADAWEARRARQLRAKL